ncbi:MAG: hypothetical protein WCS80_05485 [Bacilli bacterium]
MGIIISLVICLLLNFLVSMLFGYLIPNPYLASMITSIVIAFIYSIWVLPFDRIHFYKYKNFWMYFLIGSIVFLLLDCFSFLM